MNDLIAQLKVIAETCPLSGFDWNIPSDCPVVIPEELGSSYEKNIYVKEHFRSIIINDVTLDSHYWAIQDWGGIKSFKRNDKNNDRIRRFEKELGAGQLTKSSFSCISSLSKVASFLDPDNYAIYDSRAIYSLNWLLFNFTAAHELFPQPSGRNSELSKYDLQTIFHLSRTRPMCRLEKTAYHEYCKLLKGLSIEVFGPESKPYMLEMLLFMIAPDWIIKNIKAAVSLEINQPGNLHRPAAPVANMVVEEELLSA